MSMEQEATGGSEHRPETRTRTADDQERIQRGLEEAEREGRPIDHATARRIAYHLYGGINSPLRLLAETGAVRVDSDDGEGVDQGVRNLEEELAECRRYFGGTIESWAQA